MITVAALTDHDYTPSSRFRIRQHVGRLAAYGIQVTDHPRLYSTESAGKWFPQKSIKSHLPKATAAAAYEAANVAQTLTRIVRTRKFDARWLSRELVIGYPTFEGLVKRPFFYDLDDAVFLHRGSVGAVRRLASSANTVLAGNEYLASYCRQYTDRVHVVPTAVDTDRYTPSDADRPPQFVVGWSGTSSSFKYFLPLQDALAAFFREHASAVLKICSDRFPRELPDLQRWIRFEQWNAEAEVDQIRSFDVGLMPLDTSEWSKGKCSYKFLLYASCGVPTVCTPIGMNQEVLALGRVGVGAETPSQWRDALEFCLRERASLPSMFEDCRKVAVEHFSASVVARRLAAAMTEGLEST